MEHENIRKQARFERYDMQQLNDFQTANENTENALGTTNAGIGQIASEHGFALIRNEEIPEIEGSAHIMQHLASGARLLYLKNDDANKAFSISFKTPTADDTGVFHILEHSVLCGSEKFPVKEPFVNLLKSSMQTFLNAMTFPDKTMYPVASTNEQDLTNLMDVYLDAVFHPAIYEKRTIFEQEGWHYELAEADVEAPGALEEPGAEAPDAPEKLPQLVYNGVVFNEMKGALSDPESVLYDALSAALFPDTTYRFESGGTPEAIPTLTYEDYLDTHARHYRPDNSYITLYGNLDLGTFLGFLNERYLAPLAEVERAPLNPNPLEMQEPVLAEGVRKTMGTASENAACALGFIVGTAADRERVIATDILLDAIMGSNEAPMKRALLDAGLAADAGSYLADALLQPFAVIQLRGLRTENGNGAEKVVEFKRIVREEAERLANGGLDHELLEAALSHAEFIMREGNFGYADGVLYAMSSMCGWLYGDELATAYLRYDDAFKSLREKIDTGYFEQLLRELILENDHWADVELVPTDDDGEAVLEQRLAEATAAMTAEDFAQVEREVEILRAAQESPDAPEDLAKLPQLGIEDIGDAPDEPAYGMEDGHPLPLLRHTVQKHGISYAYRYFDLDRVAFEDLPYVSVLAMMLGKLDTAHHSAAEIDTIIQGKLGNFSAFAEVHEISGSRERLAPKLVISTSTLEANVEYMASFVREILTESNFSCESKILDVLTQKKVAMELGCANNGHSAAMARVASYYLPAAVAREQLGGMDFYVFLKELVENWPERSAGLVEKLGEIASLVFADDNCLISWSGTDESLERFWAANALIGRSCEAPMQLSIPTPTPKNEAFVVPTDVTYTAIGYDRRLLDEDAAAYSGSWLVASRALSFDYLWNEVRVKGGAYGCGFQTTRPGSTRFYSYRDPRIDATIDRFSQAGAWLSEFTPSEPEMCGYVVSTTAAFDAPQKPRELIRRQDGQFFADYTPETRKQIRGEIVATTPESVRELGSVVSQVTDQKLVCTFGNREIIEKSAQNFLVRDILG